MLASIAKFVLDWLAEKLMAWASALVAKLEKREENKKDAGESVDPLKKADPNSEKEIDDATKGALDGF